MTVFYGGVLPEHLPTLTDILADIMRPAIRQEDFDLEKNVILEEIAMYRDQPFWVLYERAMEDYYGAHALAHRVLGTDQTVTDLKRDEMQAYFDDRYSADNTTVALAGNLDFDAMVAQLRDLCGTWQTTEAARDNAAPVPNERRIEIEDERVTRAYQLMVTPAPSAQDDRRYAAALLAKILGDTGNSRLHWALIETGLAEEAQAAFDPRDGCGDYFVYTSGVPARAKEIWEVVERELDGLVESLTDDDLERLRNTTATAATLAGERPSGRMQRIGRQWLYQGAHTTLEEELSRINAVTLDDLRAVWEAYPFQPRTYGKLMPKG
jgi:predicted Zn-dependent peptidase